MQSLVVHPFSTSAHHHMQVRIPEARPLSRQLHQLRPQRFVTALAATAVARHCHHHQPERSPLAEGIVLLHLPDSGLQRYELQPFFGSPTAALLCPGSNRPPVSAAAYSRRATAWPPAPGSRPSPILSLPGVDRMLRDAYFPCHVFRLTSRFELLQRPDHLRFRVPAPGHACSPF